MHSFLVGFVCFLCLATLVGILSFIIWRAVELLHGRYETRLLFALTQCGGIQINILKSGKVRVSTLAGPDVSGTNVGAANPLLTAAANCANALGYELVEHPEYRRQFAPVYDALEACGFKFAPHPDPRYR
jgi:hypothetical protein